VGYVTGGGGGRGRGRVDFFISPSRSQLDEPGRLCPRIICPRIICPRITCPNSEPAPVRNLNSSHGTRHCSGWPTLGRMQVRDVLHGGREGGRERSKRLAESGHDLTASRKGPHPGLSRPPSPRRAKARAPRGPRTASRIASRRPPSRPPQPHCAAQGAARGAGGGSCKRLAARARLGRDSESE
jgi:hypothetical protein